MRGTSRWRAGASAGLILAALAGAQPPASPSSPPGRDASLQALQTGNGLLQRGMNELAAEEYRTFLKSHASHEKAPMARYGLAVALTRMSQYEPAEEQLRLLMDDDGFAFAAEVRVMLGQCLLAASRPAEAAEVLGDAVAKYGTHELADDAAALRVEALYRGGEYEACEAAAADLAMRWPVSPSRARSELLRGSAQLARGQFAAAAACLEALVSGGAGDVPADLRPRATLLLAQSLHRAGQGEKARPRYDEVIKGGDETLMPDALLGLGALHQEQNRTAEAAAAFDRLIERYEKSPRVSEARLRRARLWFEQKDYARAEDLLERVRDDSQGLSDEAEYWLAKCELRTDRFRESADRLERAIKKFDKSRLQPEMRYDRAVALVRADDAAAALAALDEFRERFPDHPLASDAMHLTASVAHQEGDHASALAAALEFERRFPSHVLAPAVAFIAAESTLLSGDDEGAATAYGAFLEKYPRDERAERASFRLGCTLHKLGRLDESRPLLERVARGAGTAEAFRPSLLLLGDIAVSAGEWAEAQVYLTDYLSFGLEQPSADDALLKLGLAHQRQGRPSDAVKAYDHLLERFDNSPLRLQATFERGQALVAMKQPDAAAEAFGVVLAQGSGSRFAAYAHNHLGAIASAKGDKDAAVEHFGKAAELGAGTELEAEALFEQGRSLAAAGQYEEAAEVFDRLIEAYPSSPRVGEAHARLAIVTSRQDRFDEALERIADVEVHHAAALPAALKDSVAYEKAWCLRRTDRADEAAPVLKDLAGRAEPALRAYATVDLAEIEAEAGRYGPATELLRGVLASRDIPADLSPRAQYQLGVCAFRMESYADAADAMGKYLAGSADGALAASAGLVAGESNLKLGKHKAAADLLRRVVEKFPDDASRPTAMLRLGEALTVLQQWTEAEKVFGQHLAEYGSSELWFQARFGLGYAREAQGRFDEAVSEYRQVVEKHQGPTAARAQFQIGECLFAQKQHESAARELLKVDILYDYPEWSAAALFEAGRCFEALGQVDRARQQYELVRTEHKDTRWANLAAQRLEATKTQPVPGRRGG